MQLMSNSGLYRHVLPMSLLILVKLGMEKHDFGKFRKTQLMAKNEKKKKYVQNNAIAHSLDPYLQVYRFLFVSADLGVMNCICSLISC